MNKSRYGCGADTCSSCYGRSPVRTELQELIINGSELKPGDKILSIESDNDEHPLSYLYFRRREEDYAVFDIPSRYTKLRITRFVDVPWTPKDENWVSLGKFSSEFDERMYELSMNPDDIVSGEFVNHYALVTLSPADIIDLKADTFPEIYNPDGCDSFYPVGAIVETAESGAVDVSYYYANSDLDEAWQEVVSYYGPECNDNLEDY
jgi:hypothetical protein